MESNTVPYGFHWIPYGMEAYPPWIPWNTHMDSMEQIPNSMEILQGNNSIVLLSKIYQHQELNTQLHNLLQACTTELLQLHHATVTRYKYKVYKACYFSATPKSSVGVCQRSIWTPLTIPTLLPQPPPPPTIQRPWSPPALPITITNGHHQLSATHNHGSMTRTTWQHHISNWTGTHKMLVMQQQWCSIIWWWQHTTSLPSKPGESTHPCPPFLSLTWNPSATSLTVTWQPNDKWWWLCHSLSSSFL